MSTQLLLARSESLILSKCEDDTTAKNLAIVEIFINAAIACVCHTRELLPWDSPCFQTRHIEDLHSETWQTGDNMYVNFCELETQPTTGASQEFRVLKRGIDKRADSVLDLVENGVFAAIDGGFLDTVRFFLTRGGSKGAQLPPVLEAYTLTFGYEMIAASGRKIHSVSFNSSPAVTANDATKSFKKAIKTLLTSLTGLPLMPRRRNLGVAMLYNSKCPPGYEAPGFMIEDSTSPASADQVESGWHKIFEQPTGQITELEAGPYRVVVGASYVKPTLFPTSSDLNISKRLKTMLKSSSQRRSDLISTLSDVGPQNAVNTPRTPGRNKRLSQLISSQQNHSTSTPSVVSTSSPTAPPSSAVMTRRSRKRNIVPRKVAEVIVHACAWETNQKVLHHIFDPEMMAKHKILRLAPLAGSSIRCECGDDSDDNELLYCNLCGTSQHMSCYGFREIGVGRLPDEHFCYSCLLLPREPEINVQMPRLVFIRLALGYIFENEMVEIGPHNNLICTMRLEENSSDDVEFFNSILDQLIDEGFITRTGTTVRATKDQKKLKTAHVNYVNALAQISHHFAALKDGENSRTRERAIGAAVKDYTKGRPYLVGEADIGGDYDVLQVTDAFGELIERWGYYPDITLPESRKRKATSPPAEVEETPPEKKTYSRKASRCLDLVRLDRSSSTDVMSLDEAYVEAVKTVSSITEWEDYNANGGYRSQN